MIRIQFAVNIMDNFKVAGCLSLQLEQQRKWILFNVWFGWQFHELNKRLVSSSCENEIWDNIDQIVSPVAGGPQGTGMISYYNISSY